MKVLFILILTVILKSNACLRTRFYTNQQHEVSEECCQANSGKVCGRIFTSCCKNGCESRFTGEYCLNGEEIQANCQKLTCLNVCKSKGGKVCGVSVSKGSVDCCLQNYCKASATRSGSIIDSIKNGLIAGANSKLVDSIFHDSMEGQGHQYFIDTVLQKVMGRNNICEIGNAMDLGKCLPDSSVDLLLARGDA